MPQVVPLQKFEVSYRNKQGDMTTKKTNTTGISNSAVRADFESRGYQVLGVVFKGLTGRSVTIG